MKTILLLAFCLIQDPVQYERGQVFSRATSMRPMQQAGDITLTESQIADIRLANVEIRLAHAELQNAELRHENLIAKLRIELRVPPEYVFFIDTNRFGPKPEPKPPIVGRP